MAILPTTSVYMFFGKSILFAISSFLILIIASLLYAAIKAASVLTRTVLSELRYFLVKVILI